MAEKKEREPLTVEDVRQAVEDLLGGSFEVVPAGSVQADDPTLVPYIERIIHANDIPDAWVSDESRMGDFIPDWGAPERDRGARQALIAERLGIAFDLRDRVVAVARRLRDNDRVN